MQWASSWDFAIESQCSVRCLKHELSHLGKLAVTSCGTKMIDFLLAQVPIYSLPVEKGAYVAESFLE